MTKKYIEVVGFGHFHRIMNIEEAKKILKGDIANKTDEEIQQTINTAQLLAEIAIDTFMKMTPEERNKFVQKSKTKKTNK